MVGGSHVHRGQPCRSHLRVVGIVGPVWPPPPSRTIASRNPRSPPPPGTRTFARSLRAFGRLSPQHRRLMRARYQARPPLAFTFRATVEVGRASPGDLSEAVPSGHPQPDRLAFLSIQAHTRHQPSVTSAVHSDRLVATTGEPRRVMVSNDPVVVRSTTARHSRPVDRAIGNGPRLRSTRERPTPILIGMARYLTQ